jgi:mitochondrial chaperone BCS1
MHSDSESMDGLQTMGIINALKTGNIQLDLIIAMCIPLLLRLIFVNLESLGSGAFTKAFWVEWWVKRRGYNERFLVSKSLIDTERWSSAHTSLDHDTQNSVLVKAIKLYVHSMCKVQMDSANLELTSTLAKNQCDGYYSEDERDEPKTLVGTLAQYKLINRLIHGKWHDLGMHGKNKPLCKVELFISEFADTVGSKEAEKERTTLKYHLRSLGPTSIDDFVEKAYNWYLDELRKLEDNSRHYYELRKMDPEEDGGSAKYKRYKLSDEKTLNSLFFPQKESLLKLVDHFQDKTGKYSVKGYPHKLGLLLHGPPGKMIERLR